MINLFKISFLFIVLISISSCTSFVRFTSGNLEEPSDTTTITTEEIDEEEIGYQLTDEVLTGKASYYHNKFHGRLTSNGEVFDNKAMTAAHKTLPFNTMVLVRNLENDKTIVVRINDRGPFVRGRIIDLSRAAAEKVEMIKSGVVEVEVTILK